jgi:peptide/nickel transport system substrate-binding protein
MKGETLMKRKREIGKRWIVFLALLACLIAFATSASAAPEGTLIVGVEADPYAMDPLAAWMGYGMMITRTMYDTLLDFGPDGNLNPRLATSWELLDPLHWRFHLREGVKFHNGYPFTAEDVKFTMERILDPENKCRYISNYQSYDKLVVVDDHTIDIITKVPDPLLLNRLASFGKIVSKKWVEENGVEKLRKHAMGTGPFKFVSWKRKDRLTLEANTDHYETVPKVKTLVFRPVPEMGARMAELQAGGVQITTNVPPFMIPKLEEDPNVTTQNVLSLRSLFMIIDTLTVEELQDKRVRQALNYGVDKEAIVSGVLSGLGEPSGLGIPMQIPRVDQSIKPYPYDPEKAKALLAEAGYEGLEVNLYSPSGRYPMDKEVVQAVADQLTKIGIKPKVHVMETQKYFGGVVNHELHGLMLVGFGFDAWDQIQIISMVDPKHVFSHYHEPTMTELITELRAEMDIEKATALGYKMQGMMHEEAIKLFLYTQVNTYGLSKKVQGFEGRSDDAMDLWEVSLSQ